ncbi:hypothetical protein O2N63_08990 [Aliiroseovarius sp. KMU-50]|uniref:Uncharacterized protein n=1 Tax=Aliiroseovarius salicola TaxID=3009082 RepID=A0ABT4W129_9RHOB|nr:hypothetical protein [Aliiroseovarius sp. KMU-50]MDA5094223.1 hypothetical protein [Aliiroseovarius sp. KMU-50]
MKILRKILIVLYFFGACALFLMPVILYLADEVPAVDADFYTGVAAMWGTGLFLFLNATLLRGNANDDSSLIGLAIEARKAEFRRRIRERNTSNVQPPADDTSGI